mgnify:CR=1 FL=1|tara:strand:- start:148 stop:678 length:531 start_codon:yes stop_codon:yes gene_type:complete
MNNNDIIKQTGLFIMNNIVAILIITSLFTSLMVYIILNNIKFNENKKKISKVIVIEKMGNKKDILDKLNTDVKIISSNNNTCGTLKNKESCTSLGTCVWVKTKDKGNKIQKCIEALELGNNSTQALGSDGPTDMCYCSKDGKLIPWEEYYYLDGSKIIKKKARPCLASGDKCNYKK